VDLWLRSSEIPSEILGFGLRTEEALNMKTFWPAGEEEATLRLNSFLTERLKGYTQNKESPVNDKVTSLLSPYLALGVISPRTWCPFFFFFFSPSISTRDKPQFIS